MLWFFVFIESCTWLWMFILVVNSSKLYIYVDECWWSFYCCLPWTMFLQITKIINLITFRYVKILRSLVIIVLTTKLFDNINTSNRLHVIITINRWFPSSVILRVAYWYVKIGAIPARPCRNPIAWSWGIYFAKWCGRGFLFGREQPVMAVDNHHSWPLSKHVSNDLFFASGLPTAPIREGQKNCN